MDYDSIRFLAQLLGEELNWERPTLRDQFATAALQGLLGNSEGGDYSGEIQKDIPGYLAELSYVYADRMMEARK